MTALDKFRAKRMMKKLIRVAHDEGILAEYDPETGSFNFYVGERVSKESLITNVTGLRYACSFIMLLIYEKTGDKDLAAQAAVKMGFSTYSQGFEKLWTYEIQGHSLHEEWLEKIRGRKRRETIPDF